MEGNLFQKYNKVLQEKTTEKEHIIECIQNETGVVFKPDEIVIQKKTVTLHTSSVKKTIFKNKNGKDLLKKEGYTLLF